MISGSLGADFEKDHAEIPWRDIKTMQNRLTHHDEAADYEIVWSTITSDFAQLGRWAEELLGRRRPR